MTAFRTALTCPALEADPEVVALTHFHLAEALDAQGYLEAALGEYRAFTQWTSSGTGEDANPALARLALAKGTPRG